MANVIISFHDIIARFMVACQIFSARQPLPQTLRHGDAVYASQRELFLIRVLGPLAAQRKSRIDRTADADIGAHGKGNEVKTVANIAEEEAALLPGHPVKPRRQENAGNIVKVETK